MRIFLIILLSFLLFSPEPVSGKNLGTVGAVYPVAERDALLEIQERVREVDWGKIFDREKYIEKVRAFKPKDLTALKEAEEDSVYLVDLTYTLGFDIPDGKGGILYPEGYTFNPLDYVTFPGTIVVIDGSKEEQVEWFSASGYAGSPEVMLLITDGSYYDLMERLGRPVYYATGVVVERLKLHAVPSVIAQRGNMMEVRVIAIGKARRSSD